MLKITAERICAPDAYIIFFTASNLKKCSRDFFAYFARRSARTEITKTIVPSQNMPA